MDRDHSDNASPKELSSFDVAKMSEAEVAAEIAQHMTRWRRAMSRAGQAEGAPRAEPLAAARSVGSPVARGNAGPGASSDAAGARMARAMQLAAERVEAHRLPALGPPAESATIDIAVPPEPERRADQVAPPLHAPARAVRRAPARWAAIAAALVAAGAIAGWILLPFSEAPPPEVVRPVDAPRADAGASVAPTPAAQAAASQQAASPRAIPSAQAPPAIAPTKASAPLPAVVKPALKGPALAVRLKPDANAAARPSPAQPQSAPVSAAAPQASSPRAKPQDNAAPEPPRGTGADDDMNDMFQTMFSDGLGRRLPRRRSWRAPRARRPARRSGPSAP